MKREILCEDIAGKGCGLKRVLDLIGGKWKILILCYIDAKWIGRFGEMRRTIYGITNTMLASSLKEMEADLATYFITSGAKVSEIATAPAELVAGETGIKVAVTVATGDECERCWIHSETVGKNEKHPTLCARCASVLS